MRASVPTLVAMVFVSLSALDLDELRHKAKQKTESVRSESLKKVEQIHKRFAEFKADIEKLRPGLNIVMPIDTKNAGKLRLVDHNELPGIPEDPKVFAIVTHDYQLKSWHAEEDVENLDFVRAGEKVEVVMVTNASDGLAWALVRTAQENEGYIPQRYLTALPEQSLPSSAKKETKYVITPAGLRMRSEPSLAGDFLLLVPAEAEVEVMGYSDQKDTVDGLTDYWAEAEYAGQHGWLFNGYLRPLAEKPKKQKISSGAAEFVMPIEGRISSKFGPRIDPVTKKGVNFHRGIDIAAPTGEPIKAAKAGEIYENSYNKWWGNYIIIRHADDVYTYYCHQSRTAARKGQSVKTGELIGYVGKTGKATGPHLHFEIRVGQDPKDPLQYLR
ncbi:MAG: peptidoglycan DD-metalloendopeptidase family protein [Turneriella sp.]|nr:peptidoglycan DD-metalloendopeptidase family protein [Turneriella sp.]